MTIRVDSLVSCQPVEAVSEVPRFGRVTLLVPQGTCRVRFSTPNGGVDERPTFLHQAVRLEYDYHGYEDTVPMGEPVTAVRHTPSEEGVYTYEALRADGSVALTGRYVCLSSTHSGYVTISDEDSRYFATSTGAPYVPIGPCLVAPTGHRQPAGSDHFRTSSRVRYMGLDEYDRWFSEIGRNGGNFARIWLSTDYLNVDTERATTLDLEAFARVDGLVELARRHGVRLKLCFEHFRTFTGSSFFAKVLHDEGGVQPESMLEWLTGSFWQDAWRAKVSQYLARYGDDPTVFAWELWNEMNAVELVDMSAMVKWTADMLSWLAPQTHSLCVNSLGSYDSDWAKDTYEAFKGMAQMPFQQVHRYLDQGAPYERVHGDCVDLSIDALQIARHSEKPCLLAETGAVNDCHTGPFRYYKADHRGVIFHDTVYPAFFAGAAGCGHIWHWDSYVDEKNLWWQYAPLAALLDGVDMPREHFDPFDLSTDALWVLGLKGKRSVLLWVRDRMDGWMRTLRDRTESCMVRGVSVDLRPLGMETGKPMVIPVWESEGSVALTDGLLSLPDFRGAVLAKIV